MARLIRNHLDFGKVAELRNALIHLLSADPSTPAEGQVYHNTTDHRPRVYDGTTFRKLVTTAEKVTDLTAPTGAFSMNSQKITNLADGTAATDAATYGQMLTLVNGRDWKNSVRAATTAALPTVTYSNGTSGVGATLTATANGALAAQDGVTLVANDRLLVKDQASGLQNGIYVVTQVGTGGTPFILTRATDADEANDITANLTVAVEEGTTQADKWYQITTDGTITVGTTGLTFAVIGSGTTYSAGNGLQLIGSTFSTNLVSGSGLVITSTQLDLDPTNGVPVNRGGTGAITAAGAKTSLGFMSRFAANVGDGSSTALTVTHNLGTRDVVVSVHDASTFDEIICDVQKTTTNTVTLTFASAPASNAYRCVVIG